MSDVAEAVVARTMASAMLANLLNICLFVFKLITMFAETLPYKPFFSPETTFYFNRLIK